MSTLFLIYFIFFLVDIAFW